VAHWFGNQCLVSQAIDVAIYFIVINIPSKFLAFNAVQERNPSDFSPQAVEIIINEIFFELRAFNLNFN